MADITLARPAAQTRQSVSSSANDRFVFGFPTEEATLARQGDHLVLQFEDGATLELTNFYNAHSKDNMPDFVVDGVQISGEDFFTAMNEPDLMPAAGPGAGAAARSARYNEYGISDLADGINHLEELDWGMALAQDRTFDDNAWGRDQGVIDYGVDISSGENESLEPDTPVIPVPGGPTPPAGMNVPQDILRVQEADLAANNGRDAAADSVFITAPDGLASITIAGTTVYAHGSFTGGSFSLTDDATGEELGTLTITGFNAATGELRYSFELTGNTLEHSKGNGEDAAWRFPLVATDNDGDTAYAYITVVVEDDVPVVTVGSDAAHQNVTVDFGADSDLDAGLPTQIVALLGDQPIQWQNNVIDLNAMSEGDSWKSNDGTLEVSRAGDSFEFAIATEMVDGHTVFKASKATITVQATDADGDVDSQTVQLTAPVITPGNTTPDPSDPTNPDNPDQPGGDQGASPSVPANTIIVDEGALSDGSGQHADHGMQGKGSFTVNLNGEAGTITVGDYSYAVKADGTYETSGGASLTVNGVTVLMGALERGSDDQWTVNYTYALASSQKHNDPSKTGADDTLEDSIPISVTDQSGDTATSSLKVEVHDDGPQVFSVQPTLTPSADDTADSSISGTFSVRFGADGAAAKAIVLGREQSEASEGKYIFDVDGGTLSVIDKGNGNFAYEYSPDQPNKTFDAQTFELNIFDADGDSQPVSITVKQDLNATIIPNKDPDDTDTPTPSPDAPLPDPDSDQPGYLDNTDNPLIMNVDRLVVDEGDQPEHGGDGHGQENRGGFSVDLHGEQDAVIKIGDITIRIKNGEAEPANGTASVLGVELSNVKAEFNVNSEKWDISYDYTIEKSQEHGADGTTTDVALSTAIPVSVYDGETTVTGELIVIVHDDVPQLEVNTIKASVIANIGADTIGENVSLEIFQDGDVINWGVDNKTNLLDMGNETWSTDTVSVTYQDGKYIFKIVENNDGSFAVKTAQLQVRITDADGDVDEKPLLLTRPTIIDSDGTSITPTVAAATIDAHESGLGHGTDPNSVDVEGTGSFRVNLHNESGIIRVGDSIITINENNEATWTDKKVGLYNGVEVTLDDVVNDPQSGIWTVTYKYELDAEQIHDKDDGKDILSSDIDLHVTDASGDLTTGKLAVNVHDDGVKIDVDITGIALSGVAKNLVRGEGMDTILFGKHGATLQADSNIEYQDKTLYWNNNVKLSAAIMTFENRVFNDGKLVDFTPKDYTTEGATLKTSNNSRGGMLTVESTAVRNNSLSQEIAAGIDNDEYSQDENLGEAVVFELGGLVYGASIGFGSFYIPSSNTGDPNEETAAVIFYRGNEIVGRQLYTSSELSGKADATFGDMVIGGFDKVVVAAINNGANSDFTLNSIDFTTLPKTLAELTGTVAARGADGFATGKEIPEFDYEGDAKINIVMGNIEYEATITNTKYDNSSLLTATANGDDLFMAILDHKTGEWQFNLFHNFQVKDEEGNISDFELKFTTEDREGDVGSSSVIINTGELLDNGVILFGDTNLTEILKEEFSVKENDTTPTKTITNAIKALTDDEREILLEELESLDDGNDILYGTDGENGKSYEGEDLIFGQGGDDFLAGGTGEDLLFGGSGNDVIVFDGDDYMVHGGSGIDVMVTDDTSVSLDSLLGGEGESTVKEVEVLIKGDGVLSLTNMDELSDKYGISISDDGQHLSVNEEIWGEGTEQNGITTYTVGDSNLTLEVATKVLETETGGN